MINIITGRPGGGKTYEAVAFHILPALTEGRKVVTNIPLNLEQLSKIYDSKVDELVKVVDGKLSDFGSNDRPFSTVKDYSDSWRDDKGRAPLYVVDECHMVLPNRGCNVEILEWYSLHRHTGADVILITQNARKIHRDIKDMCEVNYYCVKNSTMGSSKTYTRKVRNGVGGEVLNQTVRTYQKEYFKFYQSHTASNKPVEEATAKDVKPIWKNWTFIIAPLFILGGVISLFMSDGFFSSDAIEPVVTAPVVVTDERPVKSRPSSIDDPFHNYDLFASGEVIQIAFNNGRRNSRKSFHNIYVDVYQGSQRMFTLNNTDLVNMGYEFKILAYCLYSITLNELTRYVHCKEEQEVLDKNPSNDLLTQAVFN